MFSSLFVRKCFFPLNFIFYFGAAYVYAVGALTSKQEKTISLLKIDHVIHDKFLETLQDNISCIFEPWTLES